MKVLIWTNLFEPFLEKVEQGCFFVDLHELEGNLFERSSSLGEVHRALNIVALLKTVQSLLRVNLGKQQQDFFSHLLNIIEN